MTSAALRHSIVSDTAVMMPACSSTPSIDLIELNGDDLRRDPSGGPRGDACVGPGQDRRRIPVRDKGRTEFLERLATGDVIEMAMAVDGVFDRRASVASK